MPNKDPITVVGILATIMLVAGGAMLYLNPTPQLPPVQTPVGFTSPFKAPPPTRVTPEPAKEAAPVSPTVSALSAPALTPDELAKLTPSERSHYDAIRQSLQKVLQQVQTLEQENTHLQQTLKQGDETNQVLDAEINKLRPTPAP